MRVTDIVAVPDDPGDDRFFIEFEVLNWTDTEAFDLTICLNIGGAFSPGPPPTFASADVDPNGRPFTTEDDDGNFQPADGTSTPGPKDGSTNTWEVTTETPTAVAWDEPTGTPGNGIPPRDLLGVPGPTNVDKAEQACDLVPGCEIEGSSLVIDDPETIDNGAPVVDGEPDNVLDGFVIEVNNFDVFDVLSFDWFLTDASGSPIGVAGSGNAYGFGTYTMFRTLSGIATPGPGPTTLDSQPCLASVDNGPPLFRRVSGAAAGPGSNSGTNTNARDLFVSETDRGDMFEAEPAAQMTAPFRNPNENDLNTPVNAEPIFVKNKDLELCQLQVPQNAQAGEKVTVTATFQKVNQQIFGFILGAVLLVNNNRVGFRKTQLNETQGCTEVQFDIRFNQQGQFDVSIAGFDDSQTINVQGGVTFSNLNVSPPMVSLQTDLSSISFPVTNLQVQTEPFTVSATVQNTGDQNTNFSAPVTVDGITGNPVSGSLGPGQSTTVTSNNIVLSTTVNQADNLSELRNALSNLLGDHQVAIDGTSPETLTVKIGLLSPNNPFGDQNGNPVDRSTVINRIISWNNNGEINGTQFSRSDIIGFVVEWNSARSG